MEHAQRKGALGSRHLVVVKLHRIYGAAAEGIILRIGAEDGTQQNASLSSFGMRGKVIRTWLRIRRGLQFQLIHAARIMTRDRISGDRGYFTKLLRARRFHA